MKIKKGVQFLFVLFFVFSFSVTADELEEVISFKEDRWQVLKYSSLKPNEVKFSSEEIELKVDSSSSPLIYPFDRAKKLKKIYASVNVQGKLKLKKEIKQGEKGYDDFLFRLGLVYEGEQTLSFFKRQFAPKWVRTLFSLAPKGTGVDHIHFYNIYSDERLKNSSRKHPQTELITEEFVSFAAATGNYEIDLPLTKNLDKKVLALWVSSDGDDTNSAYSVKIKKIKVQALK